MFLGGEVRTKDISHHSTKGRHDLQLRGPFVDIRDAGDPVECSKAYCQAGADELALLDITATVENRPTMLEVVNKVAAVTTIPFTVGGGISDVASAAAVV